MAAKKKSLSKTKSVKKTPVKTYSSRYGKRPLWQWIVLYLILGVIVYGLIYYFVLGSKGGYSYQSPTSPSQSNQYPSQ